MTTARSAGGRGDLTPMRMARAALRGHLDTLAAEVDATRRDAGFRHFLDAMARFWRYSPVNQWLIRQACPHATRAAGARTWQRLGRRPRPGAQPIYIFAPGRPGSGRFLMVPVYDESQTEGEPVPELDLLLTGDTRRVKLLERAAANLGISIEEVDTDHAPLGYTTIGQATGGCIRIRAGLPGRERASTIAHELAHEILHLATPAPRRLGHTDEETEAEATSYVVMRALGLPSKAPAYIAWKGGSGEHLARAMARVQRAARTILAAAERRRPPRRRVIVRFRSRAADRPPAPPPSRPRSAPPSPG